uniref:NADH-ubiquinone oxidoreductase chain 4L n=1 Tax=Pelagocephalus marki TaxID=862803 RepID=F2EN95_9TELE|nr:NADH dehydrogenase subunit 4L [Pelagocephalus marki]BAK10063.1 NADH dehydrogenase subunit 4L [Pelagocephalus marki]
MTPIQFTISSTFLLGLSGLAFYRTHLLSALLCMECMVLSLYLALSLWALQLSCFTLTTGPLFLLTFSACEAGIGLALMIATARTHGSDHLNSLNLLQC